MVFKTWDYALLLLAFTVGAIAGMFRGREFGMLVSRVFDVFPGCAFFFLLLDAALCGSLLAQYAAPAATFALGAVTAVEGSSIITADMRAVWKRLLVLTLVLSLHFIVCIWSMGTARVLRLLMRGRKLEGRFCIITGLLMICTVTVNVLLMYWMLSAHI